MTKATAILGGAGASKRRDLDFYPTPTNVTKALMDFIALYLPPPCTVWEPACGNGAMGNVIEKFGYTVIQTDIVTGTDFLTAKIVTDAIITNPPFNLSHLFIKKAVQEARVVGMLLKSQYWHAAKRYKLFKEHPPAFVLPLTWRPDFMEHERKPGEKGASTMDCQWTVWIQGSDQTKYEPLLRPSNVQNFLQ